MAIPDFQSFLLPMLLYAADGVVHTLGEAREALAASLHLTAEDRAELLPSGRQPRFHNRVAWAKVYLEQAGLIVSPRRGHFQITEPGRAVAAKPPARIDISFLEQFEDFRAFRAASRGSKDEVGPPGPTLPDAETPEEVLERAYQSIRAELVGGLADGVGYAGLGPDTIRGAACGRRRTGSS